MQRALGALGVVIGLLAALPAGARDGVIEVQGTVQAMPSGGSLLGTWTIGGRTVRSDAATLIKQEHGRIAVGAVVEVKGSDAGGGVILATVIEVAQGAPGTPPPPGAGPGDDDGEFTGAVEAMPASGLAGSWRIAGRTVIVVSTTRLDQEHGGFRVGATVEVHGIAGGQGVVTASTLEVQSGGAATPVPPGPGALVELVGLVESLPAGSIGEWRVAGRAVEVSATTVLDDEDGAFAAGVTVEVHGTLQASGGIAATRIERTRGNGASAPALRFWGQVEAMPAAATAPLGQWRIGGRVVSVVASTQIEQEDGPLAIGAIAEVSGWLQGDGVILARELQTRSAIGAVAGQAAAAVEFVNERLGHYFLTAFPAEIAALDAGAFGGSWRRTGASFRVGGGSAAVCRFYGLPPRGPDSHFFTVDPAECETVMRDHSAWTFEAHAFSITPAVGGSCPAGTQPVTRFYNNPSAGAEMNHRYVVSADAVAEMRGRGWIEEGIVMCARP
ncbi:MAG TPA: DUF5666 domain-containing protein [Casimicrobiaceae bacterium]